MKPVAVPVELDLQAAHDQALINAEAWTRYAEALAEHSSVCDHRHQGADSVDTGTVRCQGCGRTVPRWVME